MADELDYARLSELGLNLYQNLTGLVEGSLIDYPKNEEEKSVNWSVFIATIYLLDHVRRRLIPCNSTNFEALDKWEEHILAKLQEEKDKMAAELEDDDEELEEEIPGHRNTQGDPEGSDQD